MSKQEEEESSILQYVKAAASSTDRARTVMIVMVSASVLVFVGFWNSRPGGGWLDRRIEIRRDALRFFNEPGKVPFDPKQDPSLTAKDPTRFERAIQFIHNSNFNTSSPEDKTQLLEEITELRRIRTEKIRLIQVPFFGAVFDMNDIGVFAGVTFIIVLLWFRYSLSRELRNLRLAFKEAEDKGHLKLCYDLLAMQQVLTVPPVAGQKRSIIWVVIPKALFLIPLLILFVHLILNWESREYGYLLSVDLMKRLLIVNAISVVLTAILTSQCIFVSHRIDEAWKDAARRVYS